MIAFGCVMCVVISLSVSRKVYSLQAENVHKDAVAISDYIMRCLRDRQVILADYAGFPFMIQAVMQPEVSHGNTADFMGAISLMGGSCQLVLLDYRGRMIHATRESPLFDYGSVPEFERNGLRKDNFWKISHQDAMHYWRIIAPVIYNKNVEGYLVAELPMSAIDEGSIISRRLANFNSRLELFSGDELIESFGAEMSAPTMDYSVRMRGLTLRFRFDRTAIDVVRRDLLREIVFVVGILTLLVVVVGIYLGNRFFAVPLRQLRKLTAQFGNKGLADEVLTGQWMKDVRELFNDFVRMSGRVELRTAELEAVNLSLVEEISERKRSEKKRLEMEVQLRQAQKMESIGQLAAGIAHEINTPIQYVGDNTRFIDESLAGIMSLVDRYAEIVESLDGDQDERLAELDDFKEDIEFAYLKAEIPKAISETLDGVGRISNIVLAMKDFSHPGTVKMTAVDINHAIRTTVTVARNEWKYHAELEMDLADDLPPVICLPNEINQALLNLITNAAHAIEERNDGKGMIAIRTVDDGEWVVITLRDTGIGIAEDIRDRVYDPFFTTKKVGKGTGQGLAIVYGVIKKHGGVIDFESNLREGTTFVIRLPVSGPDVSGG